jgi:hypothetical protein
MLKLAIAAAMLAAAFASGFAVQGWRKDAQIAEIEAANSAAVAAATAQAMEQTTEMQRKKDDALRLAAKRAQENAAAAAAARAERDGLRNQINTATSALPTATCASSRDYAATAAALFDQCAAALEELATKADGHATDSRTLTNSWPTTERKP